MAEFLAARAPRAFRHAQNVLVAAQKYRNRSGGFFSSDRSRLQRLENEIGRLLGALIAEGYYSVNAQLSERDSGVALIVDFMSAFSDAFPNWQKEYQLINAVLLGEEKS
ncbi:MAG: hypothetical protein VYB05_11100 [Pseudomonadota bacterium]|nr:hypothetical protein [Pseudomonadota bacterium]